MEKINDKLKGLSAKLAAAMIDHDSDEWPPVCTMFAYQPQHPSVLVMEDNTISKNADV